MQKVWQPDYPFFTIDSSNETLLSQICERILLFSFELRQYHFREYLIATNAALPLVSWLKTCFDLLWIAILLKVHLPESCSDVDVESRML
jgi:hypothetical protein